jgi:hypothetical protein
MIFALSQTYPFLTRRFTAVHKYENSHHFIKSKVSIIVRAEEKCGIMKRAISLLF